MDNSGWSVDEAQQPEERTLVIRSRKLWRFVFVSAHYLMDPLEGLWMFHIRGTRFSLCRAW